MLRLLGELERVFPELFGPLPAFVRLAMVGNGLDHAVAWSLSFESTLAQFVALQCETATDFYQHPDVRDRFASEPWLTPSYLGLDYRQWLNRARLLLQQA